MSILVPPDGNYILMTEVVSRFPTGCQRVNYKSLDLIEFV